MKNRARKIAFAGMFIALNIVLTRFLSQMIYIGGLQAVRLSFGEIPLMLSGIILGPVYGGITGALADLIGYPINAQGAYFPGFTITAALSGLLPGLMSKLVKKEWTWLSLTVVVSITTVITSLLLNTLWLNIMIGKAFVALLPPRIIASLILIPIYVIVIKLFLKHLRHIVNDVPKI
jgi:ECF transporter S component (folate family)